MLSDEELDAIEREPEMRTYINVAKVYAQAREANALRAEVAELRRDAKLLGDLFELGGSPDEDGVWEVTIYDVEMTDDYYRDDDIRRAIDAAIAKGAGT